MVGLLSSDSNWTVHYTAKIKFFLMAYMQVSTFVADTKVTTIYNMYGSSCEQSVVLDESNV